MKLSSGIISDSCRIVWVFEMTMISLSEIRLEKTSDSWENKGYNFDLGLTSEMLIHHSCVDKWE